MACSDEKTSTSEIEITDEMIEAAVAILIDMLDEISEGQAWGIATRMLCCALAKPREKCVTVGKP